MSASIDFRRAGVSRSFPEGDPPFSVADAEGRVLMLAGDEAVLPTDLGAYAAVVIELGSECLAARAPDAPAHVFGFARFRLGTASPSGLVEVVKGEAPDEVALALTVAALEEAGFQVSVCADRAGRIVDRLIRPQFNLAYAALDSGLATRDALETCVRSGLGYRQGLMDAVEAGGLEDHFTVCEALFESYGLPQFAPARQAVVARRRAEDRR